jgi:hypothetical protein
MEWLSPNIHVVKRGILIRSTTKLGIKSTGVSIVRNLSQSLALPTVITGVFGILQMVFTNLIMNTHVNRTINRSLMSLVAVGQHKNVNVVHPKGGYQKPIFVTAPFFYHRDGHYVTPNKVAFKYLDFKKNVDLDVHVRMFNFVEKTNAETFEKYIITVFSTH